MLPFGSHEAKERLGELLRIASAQDDRERPARVALGVEREAHVDFVAFVFARAEDG